MYSAIVMPTKRVHKFSSISSGLCALSSNYGVEAFWIRYTEGLLGRSTRDLYPRGFQVYAHNPSLTPARICPSLAAQQRPGVGFLSVVTWRSLFTC